MEKSRRDFLRQSVVAGAVGAVATVGLLDAPVRADDRDVTGDASRRNLDVLKNIAAADGEDLLIRMQRDLVRAMAKPVEQREWIMIIDQRKCVGCNACTVGCMSENKLPPGVIYRPVLTEESGSFPNVKLVFTPKPCNQCAAPPCVPVCPVDATWKRADGVVAIDYDKCIGCKRCISACPYKHRKFDDAEFYTDDSAQGSDSTGGVVVGANAPYELASSFEYAKEWNRSDGDPPAGKARKCHFCLHRLEEGMLPMCTTTCIGRATYFGNADDSASLVSEVMAGIGTHVLLPEAGTKPNVHYIL